MNKSTFIFAVILQWFTAASNSDVPTTLVDSTDENAEPTYHCHEYPGAYFSCASPCYPNCHEKFDAYYSVHMVLPNKAECKLAAEYHGNFRVFFPTTGIVSATAQQYYLFNGKCEKNGTAYTVHPSGSVFDGYFTCNNLLTVKVGGGNIPDAKISANIWERRLILYTQKEMEMCKEEFPLLYQTETNIETEDEDPDVEEE